jgi:valyl-tRNA synthetase
MDENETIYTNEDFTKDLQTEDRWILSLMNELVKEVTEKMDEHEIGLSTQKIVEFAWDEFCDWYVEIVKPRLYGGKDGNAAALRSRAAAQATLREVLITTVKLLHPVTPFVTEDLFLALQNSQETIMLSDWPVYDAGLRNPAAEKDIERVKEAVRGVRAIRAEKQVPPSQKITAIIQPAHENAKILFENSKAFFSVLCGAATVEVTEINSPAPAGAVSVVVSGATVYLPLDSLVDYEKEKARLTKEKKRLEQEISRIDGKLSNEGFMAKAPENLIEAEREKRENFAVMLNKVEAELKEMY